MNHAVEVTALELERGGAKDPVSAGEAVSEIRTVQTRLDLTPLRVELLSALRNQVNELTGRLVEQVEGALQRNDALPRLSAIDEQVRILRDQLVSRQTIFEAQVQSALTSLLVSQRAEESRSGNAVEQVVQRLESRFTDSVELAARRLLGDGSSGLALNTAAIQDRLNALIGALAEIRTQIHAAPQAGGTTSAESGDRQQTELDGLSETLAGITDTVQSLHYSLIRVLERKFGEHVENALAARVEALETELREACKTRDDLARRVEELESDSRGQALASAHSELSRMKGRLGALSVEHSMAIDSLAARLNQKSAECTALESRLAELAEQIRSLEKRNDELLSLQAEIQNRDHRIYHLEVERDSLRAKIQILKNESASAISQLGDKLNQAVMRAADLADQVNQARRAESRVRNLTSAEIEVIRAEERAAAQGRIALLEQEAAAHMAAAEQASANAAGLIAHKDLEIAALKNHVAGLEAEIRSLRQSKSWRFTAPIRALLGG